MSEYTIDILIYHMDIWDINRLLSHYDFLDHNEYHLHYKILTAKITMLLIIIGDKKPPTLFTISVEKILFKENKFRSTS